MRNRAFMTAIAAALAAGLAAPPIAASGEHDLELVGWMTRLQYFTHKLGLSVSAENRALQGYYIHEVEEVIEKIEDIGDMDGIEIGKLVKVKLVPAFEALEGAVEVGDQARVTGAYDALIAACNDCHQAANRPYLHIERRTDNPYMQDFAATP
jgi:hypothetical protein